MVLQAMYRKGDIFLKFNQHAAKETNERIISHLSITYFKAGSDIVFRQKLFIYK